MILKPLIFSKKKFTILVEVVPPEGENADILLSSLKSLSSLPIDGFSVATSPLAKPTMEALVCAFLIQNKTGKPAILHCTSRNINSSALQAKLWGAKALGIKTILAMTGDTIQKNNIHSEKQTKNFNVYTLINTARATGMQTGAVIGKISKTKKTHDHLDKKINAGTQFVVTQPVFSMEDIKIIKTLSVNIDIPVILGIMPLQSLRHAEFLNKKVDGIYIPDTIMKKISTRGDQLNEGIVISREMFSFAKRNFNGVCIMPPFNRFEILKEIILK